MSLRTDPPKTVEAAVRVLASVVSKEEQERISSLRLDDLAQLHHDLGLWIRNQFDLWGDNTALIKDAGFPVNGPSDFGRDPDGPDGASMFIIQAFWKSLRR